MKPDWQNKSFAKGGAATGPSTMHSKLKVGMSSLHSKIGAANSNMPQAPKPVVRKFADGGMVRGGVMSDEAYAKQMEEGAKNMERLRSAADSIKSFFSQKEKASPDNITGDTGMSAADTAKKAAMSGGYQMTKTETEEPRRTVSDYMVKPTETESKTEIQATPVETGAAPTPTPAAKKVVVKKNKASQQQNVNAQKSSAPAPTMEDTSSVSKVSAPSPQVETAAQMREKELRASGGSRGSRMDEVKKSGTPNLPVSKTKFVPGFGEVDDRGMIMNTRGGKTIEERVQGAGKSIDKSMTDAGTRYLKSKMDRGETLSAMEKAQAKRAGLI
jgi:hypothetical protein